MDWAQLFATALASSVFTGAVLGVAGILSRSIIDRWFVRNLEKFKAELQGKNAREIEALRTELRRSAFEHEIRFARLHEERAKIIAELYGLLVDAQRELGLLIGLMTPQGAQTAEKTLGAVREKGDLFVDYLNRHLIFLPESLGRTLNAFRDLYARTWIDYKLSVIHGGAEDAESFAYMKRGFDTITERIPELKREIESEFRRMLVSSSPNQQDSTEGKR